MSCPRFVVRAIPRDSIRISRRDCSSAANSTSRQPDAFSSISPGKLAQAEHIVAIDVHTGPGGFGQAGKGSLDALYRRIFPGAKVHFTVQEFGTCSRMRALRSLRDENRSHHHGGAAGRLLEVFCPANAKWRQQVLARGEELIVQGLVLAFESAAADSVPTD